MRIDDIDWRRAVVLIRGKGKLHDWMPLPDDVGAAIADHLRDSTVRIARNLFVTQGPNGGAPYGSAWFVNIALREAAKRAGVQPRGQWIGTHLLRHSLATRLLSQGASLQEIGLVLRHRTADATTIYAKVDIEGLRALARPWPVEVR